MRRTTTLLVGGATAVALALGGLVGGVLAESPSAGPSSVPRPALADRALAGAGGSVTAGTIARLEEEIRARPGDADLLVQLGFGYQLRWRESADASYLPRSESALRRALRARPGDANAFLGLGSLALIQHEFRNALTYGLRAKRLLPDSARPLGVIGDALVELGRYGEAFAAFEQMVSLRPNLASYSRIAYARELTGDPEGAIAAMQLALDAAGGQPEPTAWSLVELARLEFGRGQPRAAQNPLRGALRVLPGYPAALTEVARLEAAHGRFGKARAAARRAADAVPTPQAVALLADLLDRAGRKAEAARQRATVAVIERILRVNGVEVDLESAVYRADQGFRTRETVILAKRARADRPSIHGDDALGWALARAGLCSEALEWSERSLRLGTKDALLYFHRGYAEGCAGNPTGMREWYTRALALNPEFSVRWAPIARGALRR
jgi:tetratricopeptide (TPR) repeat protein